MNWSTTRLKNVALVKVSNVDKRSTSGEQEVRLCNYVDVYKNDEIAPDMNLMRATATHEQVQTFQVHPGDTLLTKDSETSEDIAVPAYVREASPGMVCGYHLALVRPAPMLHPKYLYWTLASLHFRRQMTASATGITRFGLRQELIGNSKIPLPPLDEQCRIADFLDAETACIDRVLQIREAQQGLLTEKRDAEISEILIPGILTHPCRLGPWPWLPDLPPGTPLVRLGYLARLQNGVTVDANRKVGDAVTLPYVRVANVQAGRLDLREIKEITVTRDAAKQAMLRVGDVLMTEGGDLDKLGRGTVWRGELPECLHQNHVFAIRTDPEYLDPEYLALMTQTAHGRCYFESTGSRTTNLASTNSTKILSFPVPLTCIEDQRSRVRQIRRLLDQVQVAKSLLHSQSALLRERRQVLITAAVTGQFDVSTASGRSGLRKRPSGLRQAGIRRDE